MSRDAFRSAKWLAALVLLVISTPCAIAFDDEKEKPLTAKEAIEKVDQNVFVEFTIRAAKNRLEKRGEIYLDSEADFHDRNNLATVITREGAESFEKAGVKDPAEHFKGKKIRVRGKLIIKDEVRRIEVTDAKQIELVKE